MFIEIEGVQIHYERFGTDGPNVLLLHGWGCSIELYRSIIDRLALKCQVTALDFPGHGKSGRPSEPWDATAFARMVAIFIEELGIRGCHIIGHSHGGRTALRLALDKPYLIGRLILTGCAGLRSRKNLRRLLRNRLYKVLKGAISSLEKMHIFGGIPKSAMERLRAAFGSADYKALDESMRRTFVLLVNCDLTLELPNIKASTLLIWGDKDTETPLWMGQTMAEKIPDAGLVTLPGCGHFAYAEQPDKFCRIALQFILT